MSKWKEYKLGDIVEIKYGKDHKKLKDGCVPVYGSGGIMRYVENFIYDKPSVLIPRKGTLNNIFYVNQPFWVVDTIFWTIIDEEKVDVCFLYNFLSLIDMDVLNVGSAVPSLTIPVLSDINIVLPCKDEQILISTVITSLDDKIAFLAKQNQTIEALAQTYFRQWFIEASVEGWQEKGLDQIATFLNGLALQKHPCTKGEPLTVIKIKELNNGYSENSDICSADIPEKYIVHAGDVVFSWSGSLTVDIWKYDKGALNQHLFKVTSEEYPKWFYYYWIKQHLIEFKIIAESKATTMGHIQRGHLTAAKVSIPSEPEFEEMNKIMCPLLEKIEKNNAQILTLQKLRDTLLPKLISGEVRVKGV